MWEGLARTERQDRVLHGAAKVANVLLGIVLLPLWLFGQLIGGRVRDFLTALEQRSRRPLPIPPERERTMTALMADLHAIPNHLRHSDFAELRRGLADMSNFVVAQHREGAVIGYRYPGQFKDHIVEGADGERIAASIAVQEAARPGLIVVHGLFTSSRFDYVRQIAVRAFYEWGFNVAALDLRSFGMTELTSPAPSTAGWKEGLDILSLAAYMKELGSTSVGALGISLGGSSVLNACDEEATARDLDGGILAVSPPAVPKEAWARLAEDVPRDHPRYLLHRAFEAALVSRVRSGRWPPSRGHESRNGVRLGALLRRRCGSDLDARPGHRPRPQCEGPAAHPSSRGRPDRQGGTGPPVGGGRRGERPRPCLDPSYRLHGLLEAAGSDVDPRRLQDLLRALGKIRGAPGGQERASR
jgi:pimeloyl-ACP methyl ester carboxylesterase